MASMHDGSGYRQRSYKIPILSTIAGGIALASVAALYFYAKPDAQVGECHATIKQMARRAISGLSDYRDEIHVDCYGNKRTYHVVSERSLKDRIARNEEAQAKDAFTLRRGERVRFGSEKEYYGIRRGDDRVWDIYEGDSVQGKQPLYKMSFDCDSPLEAICIKDGADGPILFFGGEDILSRIQSQLPFKKITEGAENVSLLMHLYLKFRHGVSVPKGTAIPGGYRSMTFYEGDKKIATMTNIRRPGAHFGFHTYHLEWLEDKARNQIDSRILMMLHPMDQMWDERRIKDPQKKKN